MKWFVAVLALAVQQSPCRSETFIRVNQSGYELHDSKIAIAFSDSELPRNFTVERGSQVLLEGVSKPITNANWGKWKHHVELDFSRVVTPGTNLVMHVGAVSVPIRIAEGAYTQLPDVLLEFMREQRCGYNPFLQAPCHTNDGRTAYGPLPPGTLIDATGGWHDAADLLKYLLTSGNATAQLLVAYDLRHKAMKFTDHFGARGEAKPNGMPDILDEARWGLEWMLKLHPAPNQLYHQVADDRDHSGMRLPNKEIVNYGWGPGSNRVVYFADGKPQGLLGNTKVIRPALLTLPDVILRPWASRALHSKTSIRRSRRSASKPASTCIRWVKLGRACSKVTPTASLIATPKQLGPTIWNGARLFYIACRS